LLSLTNGNTHPTTWLYDEHGRATNKFDALNNPVFLYRYDRTAD